MPFLWGQFSPVHQPQRTPSDFHLGLRELLSSHRVCRRVRVGRAGFPRSPARMNNPGPFLDLMVLPAPKSANGSTTQRSLSPVPPLGSPFNVMKSPKSLRSLVLGAFLTLTVFLPEAFADSAASATSPSACSSCSSCCKTEILPPAKVIVTGSNIPQKVKRRGPILLTASPVYIIDRAQLERSGAATTRDAIKSLPFVK